MRIVWSLVIDSLILSKVNADVDPSEDVVIDVCVVVDCFVLNL